MTHSATHSSDTIRGEDGTRLHLSRWIPEEPPRGWVLVVHGYAEHAGRYRSLAHRFAGHGLATLAVDLRGHGRSQGQRGHVARFQDYHGDVRRAFAELPSSQPRFILGHSNGALVALDWLHQESRLQQEIAGLVVTSPFLELAMQVPAWKLRVADIAAEYLPRLALPSGVAAHMVSRDPAVVSAYAADPLVFSTATAGWHREATQARARVRALRNIQAPLFYVFGDSDPLTLPAANKQLAELLVCQDKTVRVVPGAFHEVLNEIDCEQLHDDIAHWILERCGSQRVATSEQAQS